MTYKLFVAPSIHHTSSNLYYIATPSDFVTLRRESLKFVVTETTVFARADSSIVGTLLLESETPITLELIQTKYPELLL